MVDSVVKKETLTKERPVIIKGQINTGVICPAGSDYCYECGRVEPAEVFTENNRCPNPHCPDPYNWDD